MRQRSNNSWHLRVHLGRDLATGRKHYVERTFRGNKRDASKALAALVAEVDQGCRVVPKGTLASLCREWLSHATPSFSPKTVETTQMYIEDPVIPVLGSIQVAKLTPGDLDRFYRQLLEAGRSRGRTPPPPFGGSTASFEGHWPKESVGVGSPTTRPLMPHLLGCR